MLVECGNRETLTHLKNISAILKGSMSSFFDPFRIWIIGKFTGNSGFLIPVNRETISAYKEAIVGLSARLKNNKTLAELLRASDYNPAGDGGLLLRPFETTQGDSHPETLLRPSENQAAELPLEINATAPSLMRDEEIQQITRV